MAEEYDANGFPYIAEKEHPKGPLGTVKGHKTTKKQQALFGIARGMQKGETPKGYSPQAAKLAGGLSGKEVHKIASKPKTGYRRSPKSEAAPNTGSKAKFFKKFNKNRREFAQKVDKDEWFKKFNKNRREFVKSGAEKTKDETALQRVMQMVTEFEATPPSANPGAGGLPSHAASDADKFAEIENRLAALEKAFWDKFEKNRQDYFRGAPNPPTGI